MESLELDTRYHASAMADTLAVFLLKSQDITSCKHSEQETTTCKRDLVTQSSRHCTLRSTVFLKRMTDLSDYIPLLETADEQFVSGKENEDLRAQD